MSSFIHEDFMLNSETAKTLYHQYAKDMPIFDYHCHLSPQEIAENKRFSNISEIWLHGDHYKWRAMRTLGIEEKYITGDASDKEKFLAWAKTVPYTIGNPLYHWTHTELKRYFGIDKLLSEETAEEIWEECNRQLQQSDFSVTTIFEKFNVKLVGTTDDPIDSLEYHQQIKENENIHTKVVPSFRPDKAIEIGRDTFNEYVTQLEEAANMEINQYEDLLAALDNRASFFHKNGCRISDHGLQTLPNETASFEEASSIFNKKKQGNELSKKEEEQYRTYTMLHLGKLYHSLGWAMQLHIGAIRNNNIRMFNELGPDTGYDSIFDYHFAESLNGLLSGLEQENQLPKTVIYNLNPTHNYVVATAIGNFQQGGVRAKIQFGSGWWFNDQKDGMLKQMTDLANNGLLSTFVGMLTDSRSFLSYPRHEYFRRILCDLLGSWIEQGEVPNDMDLVGNIVRDISFNNAKDYFSIQGVE
ncbi:glucuronate isomerase [Bacillus sp. TS-2]|nr:glucuronate isomerase [Bacillus sp. TS-2]